MIAKLSLIPDEDINEYLLNPTTSVDSSSNDHSSSRNLFAILYNLVEQLQIAVKGITDLQQQLFRTKQSLLREEVEVDQTGETDYDKSKCNNILQSIIVLDEFCKELLAIIFVKNQILSSCSTQKSVMLAQPTNQTSCNATK